MVESSGCAPIPLAHCAHRGDYRAGAAVRHGSPLTTERRIVASPAPARVAPRWIAQGYESDANKVLGGRPVKAYHSHDPPRRGAAISPVAAPGAKTKPLAVDNASAVRADAPLMSIALEVTLLVAGLGFIALLACLIPLVLDARRRLNRLAVLAEQSRTDLEGLVRDTREAIRNLNELTQRANQQMNDVALVVHTARAWAERADRWVDEIATKLEPPLSSLAEKVALLRVGARAFVQSLFQSTHDKPSSPRGKDHD